MEGQIAGVAPRFPLVGIQRIGTILQGAPSRAWMDMLVGRAREAS